MNARFLVGLSVLVVLSACTQLDPLLKTIAAPTGVSLNIGSYNLVKNFSMNFVPSVTPKEAQNTKFSLSTSNPLAVGLSGNRATSLSPGTSLITATAVAGGLTATAQINAVIWTSINPSGSVSHFAGSNDSVGSVDGTTGSARFFSPSGVVYVAGSLFVTDFQNSTIRQINLSTQIVTTLAGSVGINMEIDGTGPAARFDHPNGICSDGTNLYVTDQYSSKVRKVVISTGVVTTLAGSPSGGPATDGIGTLARFWNPTGICIVGPNLYVADSNNNTIRKIVIATASVTTLAGFAGSQGSSDGPGTVARFSQPTGIASDGVDLYVTDSNNNTIRKIAISTGKVTTFVGSVGTNSSPADGTGAGAILSNPAGLFCDGSNLFFTDYWGSEIRKVVLATAAVSTLAGSGYRGAGDGVGTSAQFNGAYGIASDGTNLYVCDPQYNTIRKMSPSNSVTTVAGRASPGFVDAPGVLARFNQPMGLCYDQTSIFVADQNNSVIRKIDPATLSVTTFVGDPSNSGQNDGTGTGAQLQGPQGICTDGISLFVLDSYGSSVRRVIISSGVVTTLVRSIDNIGNVSGICTDGTFLYLSVYGSAGTSSIEKMSIDTGAMSPLSTGLNDVRQLCTDGLSLYATEGSQCQILKVDPNNGAVSILAGSTQGGELDGIGTAAQFSGPQGICTDGTALYVAEQGGNTIRKIVIATAVVTTIAGTNQQGDADGVGTAATFNSPSAIGVMGNSLLVIDWNTNNIRRIQ